jgi:hypothetical protein
MDCPGELEPKSIMSNPNEAQRKITQVEEQSGVLPTEYLCYGVPSVPELFFGKAFDRFLSTCTAQESWMMKCYQCAKKGFDREAVRPSNGTPR